MQTKNSPMVKWLSHRLDLANSKARFLLGLPIMKKERHIKTFPEKFGHQDIKDEAEQFIDDNLTSKNYDPEDVFNRMPYVGYFRIDVFNPDTNPWWDDTEDDWIQAKVLAVRGDTVFYYHYDTHHHRMSSCYKKHKGFAVQGNVLIKL